ncbi:MAG: hypothetical protein FVQ77_14020 [Cytophagales bacterium]|nr:hypothetical protein [Cytophagales bacterium]
MGKCAIDVAKACNYFSAGTVEFLVSPALTPSPPESENRRIGETENRKTKRFTDSPIHPFTDSVRNSGGGLSFYFLEMNTRLQVEHPVTEQITGIDLVKEQIKIAQGKPLDIKQEDLSINGHAIEVRVYAEDAKNNFMPDTGKLITYKTPQGPGIRVDDGFEQGMEIPIYYDPMIAKLITHAATRTGAIEKMKRAIDEYQITGIETTLPFGKFVMDHEAFRSGEFDTSFVEKHYAARIDLPAPEYSGAQAGNPRLKKDRGGEIAGILAGYLTEALIGNTRLRIKDGDDKFNKTSTSKWKENRMRNDNN